MSSTALDRLRQLLREEGGLIATLVDPERADEQAEGVDTDWYGRGDRRRIVARSPASMAAAGPRARSHRGEYELLVEAIYEGYLLHYGCPRVARTS
jgi:hypothetical protein